MSYTDNESIDIINNQQLKFSIQIYSNSNYNNVNNFRTKLLLSNDTIFLSNDLTINLFENSLGNDYLLLYKNFDSRNLATEYCVKYMYFFDNCLVVNVQNLD